MVLFHKIIFSILILSFASTMISMQMMGNYLRKNNAFSGNWITWVQIFFIYRDHTLAHEGAVGRWYYIGGIGIIGGFLSAISVFVPEILAQEPLVIFTVLLVGFIVIPLVGYLLYMMQKEKFY